MDFVTIGIVGKAHGIKGEVLIHPLTFDEERYYDLERVFLNSSDHKELNIESIKVHKSCFKIKFKESIDRNFAESIRNKEIQIPESEKIELPDDVYFIDDLIACNVYDSKDNLLGKLINVQESPAYDIYVVKTDEKEILIPNISKFVKHIDIEKKEIHITEIPGLLEL